MKNARELLAKYKTGQCTAEEKQLVEKWLLFYRSEETTGLTTDDFEQIDREVWHRIKQRTSLKLSYRSLWLKTAAAAAILFVLGAGLWFTIRQTRPGERVMMVNDVAPGGNKAFLTLSNGKRIALTSAFHGKLAEEAGVRITKTKDGQLVYEIEANHGPHKADAVNSIETPRGGQYEIRLPDGTGIWLNAASKLSYPLTFSGKAKRQVELSGEAYFEVAKDKAHPFIVKSVQQEVEVLGTHFNVNSYKDEINTTTTLLEGAVRIRTTDHHEAVLKPGQQSLLTGRGPITVADVKTDVAMAWKKGEFEFSGESLDGIMRKISRWYDVEVIYEDPALKNEIFSGGISRFEHVSDVLKKLSLTEAVRFKIEGRRIFIMK